MPAVHQVTITPASLDLHGGPHSQPFGELTAEIFDANHSPVTGCSLTWTSSNPGFTIHRLGLDPYRVSVGSYRPGKTTITVREGSSGKTASAAVTVYILDAGPPRSGSRGSLAGVITGVRADSGIEGHLVSGALPVGSSPAPAVRGHSFNISPGETVKIDLSTAGQPSHIVVGAAEMDDYYELDLREASPGGGGKVGLALSTASGSAPGSLNLEIATRKGSEFSDRATPVFVQLKGDV